MRYTIGTIGEHGSFQADTLGQDMSPENYEFNDLDAATAEAERLISVWPELTYGTPLTNAAIWDDDARQIVWKQGA